MGDLCKNKHFIWKHVKDLTQICKLSVAKSLSSFPVINSIRGEVKPSFDKDKADGLFPASCLCPERRCGGRGACLTMCDHSTCLVLVRTPCECLGLKKKSPLTIRRLHRRSGGIRGPHSPCHRHGRLCFFEMQMCEHVRCGVPWRWVSLCVSSCTPVSVFGGNSS